MKLKFLCHECLLSKTPNEKGYVSIPYDANSIIEMKDSYCYEFTCQYGHENHFFLAVPRYAILFDMGIAAYLEGYYREAVLDFAASYERFHEHCIFTMLWKDGCLANDDLLNLWKKMSSQSERQLGAFIALFYQKTGKMPTLLPDKAIKFRNEVTHKGKFPSKKDTYDYALRIAEYIKCNINEISSQFGFDFKGIYPAIREAVQKEGKFQSHAFPTVVTQYSCGNDFDKSIEIFKKQFHNNYEK